MTPADAAWRRLQDAWRVEERAADVMARHATAYLNYLDAGRAAMAEAHLVWMRRARVKLDAARAARAAASARWDEALRAPGRVLVTVGAVPEDYLVGWAS